MPVVKIKTSHRKASLKMQPLQKPSKPYPGYMTDEWYEYAKEAIRRTTPEEFRRELVEFGITDAHGKLTAPYREA